MARQPNYMETPEFQDKLRRHIELLHAIQTGIRFLLDRDPGYADPHTGAAGAKHLRVGITNALCETSALQALLIEKGVITPDEWADKLTALLEAEKERITLEVRAIVGSDVTLL